MCLRRPDAAGIRGTDEELFRDVKPHSDQTGDAVYGVSGGGTAVFLCDMEGLRQCACMQCWIGVASTGARQNFVTEGKCIPIKKDWTFAGILVS